MTSRADRVHPISKNGNRISLARPGNRASAASVQSAAKAQRAACSVQQLNFCLSGAARGAAQQNCLTRHREYHISSYSSTKGSSSRYELTSKNVSREVLNLVSLQLQIYSCTKFKLDLQRSTRVPPYSSTYFENMPGYSIQYPNTGKSGGTGTRVHPWITAGF